MIKLNILYDWPIVSSNFHFSNVMSYFVTMSVGVSIGAGRFPSMTSEKMSKMTSWLFYTMITMRILDAYRVLSSFGFSYNRREAFWDIAVSKLSTKKSGWLTFKVFFIISDAQTTELTIAWEDRGGEWYELRNERWFIFYQRSLRWRLMPILSWVSTFGLLKALLLELLWLWL